MGEFQEFTEALFGQLSVEIDEEKEIIKLASRANEDIGRKVEFKDLEDIATGIFSDYKNKVEEFLGVKIPKNIEKIFKLCFEITFVVTIIVIFLQKHNHFNFSNLFVHLYLL